MSAYSGRQGKGAARKRRAVRREQAEARNALTPPERRRAYRLIAVAEFARWHDDAGRAR